MLSLSCHAEDYRMLYSGENAGCVWVCVTWPLIETRCRLYVLNCDIYKEFVCVYVCVIFWCGCECVGFFWTSLCVWYISFFHPLFTSVPGHASETWRCESVNYLNLCGLKWHAWKHCAGREWLSERSVESVCQGKLIFATLHFGGRYIFFKVIHCYLGDSAQCGEEFYVQRNSIGSF